MRRRVPDVCSSEHQYERGAQGEKPSAGEWVMEVERRDPGERRVTVCLPRGQGEKGCQQETISAGEIIMGIGRRDRRKRRVMPHVYQEVRGKGAARSQSRLAEEVM